MNIDIIAIGDELTSGRILNTTSSFAARRLFEAGFDIHAMHTIGDTPQLIGEALHRALDHADAVIVTGGLGMTDDDLTNEAVSHALNRPTMPNLEILATIRRHLDQLSNAPASQLEKLAWLPSGAEALSPQSHMSGYRLIHNGKPIYFLPGIPSQMKHLLIEYVLPGLATWGNDHRLITYQRLFRIFNLPENEVNRRISTLALHPAVHIGYYPVFPEVHLSLVVREQEDQEAQRIFHSSCLAIDTVLGDAVYGHDRENLQTMVGNLLRNRRLTLATAESCTGGLISQRLTAVAGSSAYFPGGIVAYANQCKSDLLQVPAAILEQHGAVSSETATHMAEGTRRACRADIGLAVTGIAGPDGGTVTKPVGTVFIGIAAPAGNWVNQFLFSGDRQQIREMTAQTALDLIRKYLLNMPIVPLSPASQPASAR